MFYKRSIPYSMFVVSFIKIVLAVKVWSLGGAGVLEGVRCTSLPSLNDHVLFLFFVDVQTAKHLDVFLI